MHFASPFDDRPQNNNTGYRLIVLRQLIVFLFLCACAIMEYIASFYMYIVSLFIMFALITYGARM